MNETILTCAPLPPPHGGITNWYQILIRQAAKNGVTLELILKDVSTIRYDIPRLKRYCAIAMEEIGA